MFGGYCAEKIYRLGGANNLKILVLDAGPFLIPTHLQNLPDVGLDVPDAADDDLVVPATQGVLHGAFDVSHGLAQLHCGNSRRPPTAASLDSSIAVIGSQLFMVRREHGRSA